MRIVFVQTYPAYHDYGDTEKWLSLDNRDKWMPAIAAQEGHEVELWVVSENYISITYNWENELSYPISGFPPDRKTGPTKKHSSRALIKHARDNPADLYVLKGIDGGAGINLLKEHIIPESRPFSLLIGGEWYSPFILKASSVLYETRRQRKLLTTKSWKFWQKTCPEEKLIHLSKSVNQELFKPKPETEKIFDVISTGRLIPYYKNYDALITLSKHLKVAFIGGGPKLQEYREKFPEIHWLGHVPNTEVPALLNKARCFFYTGFRDYFPRVIPEAASCGLPVIAFNSVIDEDVIPETIGLRVNKNSFVSDISELCCNPKRLSIKAQNARKHAIEHWNKTSTREAILKMIEMAGG